MSTPISKYATSDGFLGLLMLATSLSENKNINVLSNSQTDENDQNNSQQEPEQNNSEYNDQENA